MKLACRHEDELAAGEIVRQGLDQKFSEAPTRPIEQCRGGVKTGLRTPAKREAT